jgi:hypothetical protein
MFKAILFTLLALCSIAQANEDQPDLWHSPKFEDKNGNYRPEMLVEIGRQFLVIHRVYKTGRALEVSGVIRSEKGVRITKVVHFNKCAGHDVVEPLNLNEDMSLFVDQYPGGLVLGYSIPGKKKFFLFSGKNKETGLANLLNTPTSQVVDRILNTPLCPEPAAH